MVIIKIMNEFLHSPIWTYEDNVITDDIPIISNDEILQTLSMQAEKLFSAYYEFDSHNQACWFNYEKEKAEKNTMLDIIDKIHKRLDEINDGSFTVEDYETERIRKL